MKLGDTVEIPYRVYQTTGAETGKIVYDTGDQAVVEVETSFGTSQFRFKKKELTLCERESSIS